MKTDFEQIVAANLEAIAPLADAIASWATATALAGQDVFHLNLVLEELVTNIILHGGGKSQYSAIRLRICCVGDVLEVELRDSGPPFDPFSAPPPALGLHIDARPVGGLGVHLVRGLMHECHYQRRHGHNVVLLRKRLTRAET
ncbi:ATP-binding protein [Rugamonas aquatica]|uniref:ATP-binding protein n=1 Tax=Rugamonas aquatica TaxID=2743357 RepID=UPI001C2DC05A|nr:ATP-binding protein [Rugamonas aquatica]